MRLSVVRAHLRAQQTRRKCGASSYGAHPRCSGRWLRGDNPPSESRKMESAGSASLFLGPSLFATVARATGLPRLCPVTAFPASPKEQPDRRPGANPLPRPSLGTLLVLGLPMSHGLRLPPGMVPMTQNCQLALSRSLEVCYRHCAKNFHLQGGDVRHLV